MISNGLQKRGSANTDNHGFWTLAYFEKLVMKSIDKNKIMSNNNTNSETKKENAEYNWLEQLVANCPNIGESLQGKSSNFNAGGNKNENEWSANFG